MRNEAIGELLAAQIEVQLDKLDALLARASACDGAFRLTPSSYSLEQLKVHLLDCVAGFGACLCALRPGAYPILESAREGARDIHTLRSHFLPAIRELTTEELERRLPSVIAPDGQALFTSLLNNFEHLLNHKHQLFLYLKALDEPVSSKDLYRWHERA